MLIESMTTSLAVGKLRGGKLKNIERIRIQGWYLFILAFIVEFSAVIINVNKFFGIEKIGALLDSYFIYIHGLSYILIFIGLILNFNRRSMILIFIGALLNFIVIVGNGGQMPVSEEGLRSLEMYEEIQNLKDGSVITHTLVTQDTNLTILGDVLPTPKAYPLSKMLSIGDIFIAVGIFILIQEAMLDKGMFNSRPKMVKFKHKSIY